SGPPRREWLKFGLINSYAGRIFILVCCPRIFYTIFPSQFGSRWKPTSSTKAILRGRRIRLLGHIASRQKAFPNRSITRVSAASVLKPARNSRKSARPLWDKRGGSAGLLLQTSP